MSTVESHIETAFLHHAYSVTDVKDFHPLLLYAG